jgi:hypothetical protein
VQANPTEITVFDKQLWVGHDSDTHSMIEAIDPATNQTSAAVQVDDFAGSVVGGASVARSSDVTDRQWLLVSPMLERGSGGPARTTDRRQVFSAGGP